MNRDSLRALAGMLKHTADYIGAIGKILERLCDEEDKEAVRTATKQVQEVIRNFAQKTNPIERGSYHDV